MATIRRRNSKYQVQIRKSGYPPTSKTFTYRADAERWSRQREVELENGQTSPSLESNVTLRALLDRYIDRVAPLLKSCRREIDRARLMQQRLGKFRVGQITNARLAEYRDARLNCVAPQTVKHEINLVRRVLKLAVDEWGLVLPNGVPSVRSPRLPRGRCRRLQEGEEAQLDALLPAIVQKIFCLAMETAMRRSELLAIHIDHVDWDRRLLHVPVTKNGVSRVIPLSNRALVILKGLSADTHLFSVAPDTVTHAFGRACRRADIKDLRFHDLRHEAISRLFEQGRSVPEVASISGHSDYRMLARYTHLHPGPR